MTGILVTNDGVGEVTSLTYFGDGVFLGGDLSGNLFRITTDGIVTTVGDLGFTAKGLTFP